MKTKFHSLFILLAISVLSASAMQAKTLCRTPNPSCPTVGYVEYVQDDNTGTIYEHEKYCDFTDCWGVYSGPNPCKIAVLPVTAHGLGNFAPTCGMAPGMLTGRYIVDAENDTFRMRTPINDTERDEIIAMWEEEFGNPSMAITILPDSVAEKIWARRRDQAPYDRLRREAWRAIAPNEDAVKELLALYTQRNPAPTGTQEDAEEIMDFLQKVGVKGKESNMSIVQQPAQVNGFIVGIEPVDPSLHSVIKIFDATGKVVWQGEINQRTDISLGHLPSGMYYMQAVGRALPILIAR
jgi:hypothetical protein